MIKRITIYLTVLLFIASCNNSNSNKKNEEESKLDNIMNEMAGNNSPQKAITVIKTIDAGSYTYIKGYMDNQIIWAAVTAKNLNKGETYYFSDFLPMYNFESKQLQRTFDTVLFVQDLNKDKDLNTSGKVPTPKNHVKTTKKENIEINPVEGAVKLSGLFENKKQYKGKKIKVAGEVVKINENIMKKNWIHIQDGSSYEGQFDLTITTTEPVSFGKGDIVSFEGIIALDKDFGAGYFYDIILEDAKIISVETQL